MPDQHERPSHSAATADVASRPGIPGDCKKIRATVHRIPARAHAYLGSRHDVPASHVRLQSAGQPGRNADVRPAFEKLAEQKTRWLSPPIVIPSDPRQQHVHVVLKSRASIQPIFPGPGRRRHGNALKGVPALPRSELSVDRESDQDSHGRFTPRASAPASSRARSLRTRWLRTSSPRVRAPPRPVPA